jgi:iron complex outermembrane receptor protein
MYHEDGTTTIDGSNKERSLVSARFTYALTPDTNLLTDVWHQDYSARGLQTYFNLGTGVAVPDASKFDPTRQYGQNWTFNKAEKTVAGVGFDSKLNETFSLLGGFRYGIMQRSYDFVGATLTDNHGTYKEQYTTTPTQHEQTHSEYTLLETHLDTWGLTHTITTGYIGTDYTYDRGADVASLLGTSTIYAPVQYGDPASPLGGTNQWQQQINHSVVAGDRIALTESLSALLGVNYAVLKQTAWGPGSAISTSNFTSAAVTPSYALMYKLAPNATTYVSYMEGLIGGDTAPKTAVNAYQVLSPSISKQYEVGVKSTIGDLNLATALFYIDRINAETDPLDNVFKHDGREVHQGLELIATGKLTERLIAIGGFTLMDARIESASANRATEGKIPVNVPEQQAGMHLEYALPFAAEVKISGGANYAGRRPVDVYNQQFMSGATVFDAGLRYEPKVFGHKLTVNLTVDNIMNKAYWAYYRSGDGLLLAQPRTVALTVKATW